MEVLVNHEVSNKMFPHPVLDHQCQDFINSSFKSEFNLVEAKETIKISVNLKLKDDNISALIDSDNADFFVHLESESTRYRELFLLNKNSEKELTFSSKNLGSRVEVSSGIIALKNILNYTNTNFVEELHGIHFNIKTGELLATGEDQELIIEKEDSLTSVPSIFAIVENQDKDITCPTWISDEQILIKLPEKQYRNYALLSQTPGVREVLITMFIIPVLVDILSRFKEIKDEFNEARESEWGKIIIDKLDDLEIDLETEDDLFSVAFRIFDNIENKAMENIQKILDEE